MSEPQVPGTSPLTSDARVLFALLLRRSANATWAPLVAGLRARLPHADPEVASEALVRAGWAERLAGGNELTATGEHRTSRNRDDLLEPQWKEILDALTDDPTPVEGLHAAFIEAGHDISLEDFRLALHDLRAIGRAGLGPGRGGTAWRVEDDDAAPAEVPSRRRW